MKLLVLLQLIIWCVLGSLLLAPAGGCATARQLAQADKAKHDAANPVSHPIASANHSASVIGQCLTWLNLLSVVGLIAGLGLFFTELSALSKIILPISGAGICVTLIGIFSIPFLPYVAWGLLAVGLGLGGYELYRWLFPKPSATTPAAAPLSPGRTLLGAVALPETAAKP